MVSAVSFVGIGGLFSVGLWVYPRLVMAAMDGNTDEIKPYYGRGLLLVGGLAGLTLLGTIRTARPGEILAVQGRSPLRFVKTTMDLPFLQSVERISVQPQVVEVGAPGARCKFCATPEDLSLYHRMLPSYGHNQNRPVTETFKLKCDARAVLRTLIDSDEPGREPPALFRMLITHGALLNHDSIANLCVWFDCDEPGGNCQAIDPEDREFSDCDEETAPEAPPALSPPPRTVMSAAERAEITAVAREKISQAGARLGFRITDLELEISPRAYGVVAARTLP